MSTNKYALLLVGSPKGEKSTSLSIGNYLMSKLESFGMKSENGFIHRLVNREEKIQNLYEMIEKADLIIISFPLYVDSLPAPVIKAMELIKAKRDKSETIDTKRFVAICNNGFPEASQNATALHICEIFAKECKFLWRGGIAIGGGGAINGVPLLEKGGMVRNVVRGLDIVAEALKEDKDIPQEAIDLLSKKFIPHSIYKIFGNLGWKMQAKRNEAKHLLKNTPDIN